MQDPRIRLITLILLSAAAWISVAGAILALAWWLICTKARTSITSIRSFLLLLCVPTVMGLFALWSDKDGISYILRISTILVIASWMYAERYPGELLDVCVWLFGTKIGFDLGLIGELSLSSLDGLLREIDRVMIALRQKKTRISLTNIPVIFSGILIRQICFAHERAILLTLRGYTQGGMHCPSFSPTLRDGIIGALSCTIFLFSLIAVTFL